MYQKDGDRYVYDGDFEQYLLGIGVEADHINKMKEKKLQSDKEKFFLLKENNRHIELVPLQKVIGTSRGTVGDSVFENVRTMIYWERDWARFEKCFKFLEKMSLDELRSSYEELAYPVEMVYYKDDDEYFLTSDGNHRTLTAMLLGAEYIKANVTLEVSDYKKKEKYNAERDFYVKYDILNIVIAKTGKYKIIFQCANACYEVNGFKSAKCNEDCYDLINRLSDEIENDKTKVELWYKIPAKVRKPLRYFIKNMRFFQYIEKRNPSDVSCGDVILCEL